MTPSEFAFLALGLVLGVASGAALVTVFRSRPPAPREIKVTVMPDSVPRRRATTLAEDAFTTQPPEPARGGPADRRHFDRDLAPGTRTLVRSGPQPPAGAGDPDSGLSFRPVAAAMAQAGSSFLAPRYGSVRLGPGDGPSAVGIRIHGETDWTLERLRISARRTAERQIREGRMTATAILERPASEAAPAQELGSVVSAGTNASQQSGTKMSGDPERPRATDTSAHAGPAADPASPTGASTASGQDDGCGEARRIADERCTLATRAREQAESAHETLRAAQRSYDDHLTRAERAMVAADPRAMRVAKETAQGAFRHARSSADTRDLVEAAARDWLTEINRINHAAREAGNDVQHERAAANALVMTIERLTVEADAARISSETAEIACVAARQAVADCQEAAIAGPAASFPTAPSLGVTPSYRVETDEETELEAAFAATGEGEPAILRLVRGDRAALGRLVAQLAGDDETERRRWQSSMADLIDALIGRAIEAGALTFPVDHQFWGSFSLSQNRDIATALGSLGFRFDGLGGWVDDRHPSQRDLSLAVGYAGLDPMRLRHWPTEAETKELFADVSVAADEFLAEAAGGLTLGELIDVLGRRADTLTELWNDWGRVRPLLLAGG